MFLPARPTPAYASAAMAESREGHESASAWELIRMVAFGNLLEGGFQWQHLPSSLIKRLHRQRGRATAGSQGGCESTRSIFRASPLVRWECSPSWATKQSVASRFVLPVPQSA